MAIDRKARAAAWAGLGLIPLNVAILPLVDLTKPFPVWTQTAQEIAGWFAEHRAIATLQAYTVNLGTILLIWFAVGLARLCAGPEAATSRRMIVPATVAYCGAILMADVFWLMATVAGTPNHPTSIAAVGLAFEASSWCVLAAYNMAGFMTAAAGTAILQSGVLPRWCGWFGWLVAGPALIGSYVIGLVDAAWLAPMSWGHTAPFILFFCWTTAVSVMILRIPTAALNGELIAGGR
jgi:hypothetical protein